MYSSQILIFAALEFNRAVRYFSKLNRIPMTFVFYEFIFVVGFLSIRLFGNLTT